MNKIVRTCIISADRTVHPHPTNHRRQDCSHTSLLVCPHCTGRVLLALRYCLHKTPGGLVVFIFVMSQFGFELNFAFKVSKKWLLRTKLLKGLTKVFILVLSLRRFGPFIS